MAKQDKKSVRYTDHASMPSEQCKFCEHFERPSGCTKVVGKISPAGWCELFEDAKI